MEVKKKKNRSFIQGPFSLYLFSVYTALLFGRFVEREKRSFSSGRYPKTPFPSIPMLLPACVHSKNIPHFWYSKMHFMWELQLQIFSLSLSTPKCWHNNIPVIIKCTKITQNFFVCFFVSIIINFTDTFAYSIKLFLCVIIKWESVERKKRVTSLENSIYLFKLL